MTNDEIMNLVNRSLFAAVGYTDEAGWEVEKGCDAVNADG